LRVGHDLGIAAHNQREKAHAVRVIGHDEEIERPGEPGALTARGGDLVTFGEHICVARRQTRPECSRIHRKRRVQVRIAFAGRQGLLEELASSSAP
jgi:hypothetical protein